MVFFGALSQLRDSGNRDRTWSREETKQFRKTFSDLNLHYTNPPKGHYTDEIIAGDNCNVMDEMLRNGMKGKYSVYVFSKSETKSYLN